MPMTNYGLSKLTEECGEVQQVVGKLLQYPALMIRDDALHPDGTCLRRRLEAEIADVIAACAHVIKRMNLHEDRITERMERKLALFETWSTQPESDSGIVPVNADDPRVI